MACGYRNRARFRTAILFHRAGLSMLPAGVCHTTIPHVYQNTPTRKRVSKFVSNSPRIANIDWPTQIDVLPAKRPPLLP